MKKYLILLLSLFILSSCTGELVKRETAPAPTEYIEDYLSSNGYTLVWSDEFNGSEINKENWIHEEWHGQDGNNEQQHYTDHPNNSFIQDDKLVIHAYKPTYTNLGGDEVSDKWTSARLTTQGKQEFQYGYMEARVKVPEGSGMWPAFWMLGTDYPINGWPLCGEIDIMEYSPGSFGEDNVYSTVHMQKDNDNNWMGFPVAGLTEVKDIEEGYHTFGILWTENFFRAYYDGKAVGETLYAPEYVADGENWPFDQKFFFILNLAIGGKLGVDSAINRDSYDYYVDYVRVYQK